MFAFCHKNLFFPVAINEICKWTNLNFPHNQLVIKIPTTYRKVLQRIGWVSCLFSILLLLFFFSLCRSLLVALLILNSINTFSKLQQCLCPRRLSSSSFIVAGVCCRPNLQRPLFNFIRPRPSSCCAVRGYVRWYSKAHCIPFKQIQLHALSSRHIDTLFVCCSSVLYAMAFTLYTL